MVKVISAFMMLFYFFKMLFCFYFFVVNENEVNIYVISLFFIFLFERMNLIKEKGKFWNK